MMVKTNNNNSHCSNENFLYAEQVDSSSKSSQQQQPPQTKLIAAQRQRSMSLLYYISRRLRRRLQHEQVCFNSQDDLRSSSTDSMSLSFGDCGANDGGRLSTEKNSAYSCCTDLSNDDHSSRASSSSGNSHESSDLDGSDYRPTRQHRHSYSHSRYRSDSDMSDCGNDSVQEDDQRVTKSGNNKSSARTPLKGLHLNRISMSSVSRMLHHISSLSSSSTSIRSLSCNSTPLKSQKDEQQKQKKLAASNKSESKKSAAKPQPQQQRILRQPVNYVYLKGMSGLPTRRVPRSSLCCSYACR